VCRSHVTYQDEEEIIQILTLFCRLFLPFSVISGIFGMNNLDTPVEASWGWVMGGTGIVCAVLFVVLCIYFFLSRPKFDDLEVLSFDGEGEAKERSLLRVDNFHLETEMADFMNESA
jgi:hypothetical protein